METEKYIKRRFMFARKMVNGKKGQALIEAALTAPLIIFFLFTIIWFGRVVLTWQQLVGAARYGTDLIAYTPYSEEEISRDIRNYLCHGNNIGRTLDRSTDTLKIEVHAADFPSIDYSAVNILNPMRIINNFHAVFELFKSSLSPELSYVEISYKFKTPPVFRLYKEYITIKAKSEVLTGSGVPVEEKERRKNR